MEKYIVQVQVYGLLPSVTLKAGQIVELRPEDAAEYLADGVLAPAPKIKTKEEKKTAK
jgi:hypothetical protein